MENGDLLSLYIVPSCVRMRCSWRWESVYLEAAKRDIIAPDLSDAIPVNHDCIGKLELGLIGACWPFRKAATQLDRAVVRWDA